MRLLVLVLVVCALGQDQSEGSVLGPQGAMQWAGRQGVKFHNGDFIDAGYRVYDKGVELVETGKVLRDNLAARRAWEQANPDIVASNLEKTAKSNKVALDAASKKQFEAFALQTGSDAKAAGALGSQVNFGTAERVAPNVYKQTINGQDVFFQENRAQSAMNKIKDVFNPAPLQDMCIRNPNFCKGNLGIPRYAMPQFTPEVQANFAKSLRNEGYVVHDAIMPMKNLKMAQADLYNPKVEGMVSSMKKGTFGLQGYNPPLLMGADGKYHVMDGQHRFAAGAQALPDSTVQGMLIRRHDGKVIDAQEMVRKMTNFEGVKVEGLGQTVSGRSVKIISPLDAERAALPLTQKAAMVTRRTMQAAGRLTTYTNAGKSVLQGTGRAASTMVDVAAATGRGVTKVAAATGSVATSGLRSAVQGLRGASVLGRFSGALYIAGAAEAFHGTQKEVKRGLNELWEQGTLNKDAWTKAGKGVIDTLAGGSGTVDMVVDTVGCFNKNGIRQCAKDFGKSVVTGVRQMASNAATSAKACMTETGSRATCLARGAKTAAVATGKLAWSAVKGIGEMTVGNTVAAVKGVANCAMSPTACAKGLTNVANGLVINPAKQAIAATSDCVKNNGVLGCGSKAVSSVANGAVNMAKNTWNAVGNWFKAPTKPPAQAIPPSPPRPHPKPYIAPTYGVGAVSVKTAVNKGPVGGAKPSTNTNKAPGGAKPSTAKAPTGRNGR